MEVSLVSPPATFTRHEATRPRLSGSFKQRIAGWNLYAIRLGRNMYSPYQPVAHHYPLSCHSSDIAHQRSRDNDAPPPETPRGVFISFGDQDIMAHLCLVFIDVWAFVIGAGSS